MKTDYLIFRLATCLFPITSLRSRAVRGSYWLEASLAYVAVAALGYNLVGGTVQLSVEGSYIFEQVAPFGPAGLATLASTIAGRDHRVVILPFFVLAAWLVIAWSNPEALRISGGGGGQPLSMFASLGTA
ncbi:MAG: hypothetical protein ACOZAM_09500 [Pseudomonadota bacterium]